jgi:hypothetical protein
MEFVSNAARTPRVFRIHQRTKENSAMCVEVVYNKGEERQVDRLVESREAPTLEEVLEWAVQQRAILVGRSAKTPSQVRELEFQLPIGKYPFSLERTSHYVTAAIQNFYPHVFEQRQYRIRIRLQASKDSNGPATVLFNHDNYQEQLEAEVTGVTKPLGRRYRDAAKYVEERTLWGVPVSVCTLDTGSLK